MILLPRVSPAEFQEKWDNFNEVCAYLELDPHDRNIAWREMTEDQHFHEWPVPMDHFATDAYYVGESVQVRPWLKDTFADLGDYARDYEIITLIAGIGSGKSFAASLLILYKLYELSCMKQPQKYLSSFSGVSLSGDAMIAVCNVSAAGARQAVKVVYGEVFEKVDASPYFNHHFPPWRANGERIAFEKRIEFSPGTSDPRSVLGFNVYAFVVDEAAFGVENDRRDSVKDLFLALNQRRRSRFNRFGLGGLFTSPGSEGGFVEIMAGEGDLAGTEVMVRRTTTWEAQSLLKPGAKVFLLDTDQLSTRILETDLTYLGPGIARRPDGSIVRFGEGLGTKVDWGHQDDVWTTT